MKHFWTWMHNGATVVTTPDEVDIANEAVLAGILRGATASDSVVTVDAATCGTFFDVLAMRVLDEAARAMAHQGGELRIAITKPKIREYLDLYLALGCSDSYLRIFEDLGKALAAPRPDWKPQLQPQAA
jgi:hypothetical protein